MMTTPRPLAFLFAAGPLAAVGLFAAGLLAAAGTAEAASKAPAKAPTAGCTWIGKRVVQALLRDDVVAAGDFQNHYKAFDCPTGHLAEVFSCTVTNIQPGTTAGARELNPTGAARDLTAAGTREIIDACWTNPRLIPAQAAPPAPAAKPAVPQR